MAEKQNKNISPMIEEEGEENSTFTVTVVIILIVVLIVSGLYWIRFVKQQEVKSPMPVDTTTEEPTNIPIGEPIEPDTPSATTDKKAPEVTKTKKLVEDFYHRYTESKRDPIKEGIYKKDPMVTGDLIKKVEMTLSDPDGTGLDPFLCATKKPTSFEVEKPKVNGTGASVIVNEIFDGLTTSVKLNLRLINNEWKIVNVTCLPRDEVKNLLESLMKKTGLDFVIIKPTVFTWNVLDHKGTKKVSVSGKGFSAKNTVAVPQSVTNFFTGNGFKLDAYNKDGRLGFQKDNTVCILVSSVNSTGRNKIEVSCGELK